MKRAAFVLSALVSALSLSDGNAWGVIVTIKGTSTGAAAAGTYVRNGETLTTSAAALRTAQDYVADYNGATEFTANYNIVLKPDKMVDSTMSMVRFMSVNYTSSGTPVRSTFTTLPITITNVVLMNGDPTMIASFMFNSTNWYPTNATGAGKLNNMGLSGSIDLKTGKTSHTAAYSDRSTGAVYTYMVMGMIMPPAPVPDPQPTEFGDREIYSPVPEPATGIMLLAGTASIAFRKQRKSEAARPVA